MNGFFKLMAFGFICLVLSNASTLFLNQSQGHISKELGKIVDNSNTEKAGNIEGPSEIQKNEPKMSGGYVVFIGFVTVILIISNLLWFMWLFLLITSLFVVIPVYIQKRKEKKFVEVLFEEVPKFYSSVYKNRWAMFGLFRRQK